MKKLLTSLCVCVLVLLCLFTLPTQAHAETEVGSGSIYKVNPLFSDCVVQQQLATGDTGEPDTYYTTEDAVVEAIRAGCVNRETTIVVGYQGTENVDTMGNNMYDNILAHTGVPTQGDYLRWHYKTYRLAWQKDSATNKTVFTCTMTYLSSATQENAVNTEVASLLDELDVYTASDYAKVSAIYDYICENVTYDSLGLFYGEKVVYTAYAALVKKTAVCQGYASLFYRLALELDVDARVIAGLGNGGAHGWNIVKLGDYYYNLDATWDAEYAQDNLDYAYFLRSPQNFENHVRNDDYETQEFHRNYPMDTNNYAPELEAPDAADYEYTVENGEATITNYTGIGGDITIPATLGGYPVTAIGDSAFYKYDNLTSVSIPDSVVTIGDWAFSSDYGPGASSSSILSSVEFGTGIKTIGKYAFWGCEYLRLITIPDSVNTIEREAFSNCYSLTSVIIGSGVTTIEDSAFFACRNLLSVQVSENNMMYSSDAQGALLNKDKTELIMVPGGYYGFFAVPNGVTNIRKNAFRNSGNLTSVAISDSVITISDYAFNYCDSLTSLTIPVSVTSLGYIQECPNLADVYYAGTQSQWNDCIFSSPAGATVHYNHTHDYTKIPVRREKPTCTANGYIEHTCAHGDVMREILPALGHVAGGDKTVVAPTCTKQGYNISTCTRCGEQENTDFTYVLGHDFSGTVTVVDPTCTQQGYTATQCIRCEATHNSDYTDSLGHELEYVPAQEATCTTSGKTYGTKCERCEYWGVAQTEIPKLGHSYAKGSCIRCGDTPAGVKITKQPADVTVEKGSYAAASVQATGDGLTYTWYHKNASASKFAASPETSATYTAYMSASSNGRYVYCVVADKYGNEVTTDTVRLYMGNFAKITAQPTNAVAPSGKYATVTVKATGDGLTYAWYHKNASASKFAKAPQTGADYSAYMSASSNGRYVYCMVTDQYGNSVKTNTVKLTMGNTVKITAQPKNTVVPSGKYATVTVKATGDGLTYTWYHKNASASKFAKAPQTGATYSAYMSASSNGRYVYCIVKDKYGNQIKADSVKLIMGNTVNITTQPKTVTVAKNAMATVSVKATGDGLTYTWYHKNASASAFAKAPQTGSSYSAYVTEASNGRYVYCMVKDQYGNQIKTNTVALRMK